MHETKSQQINDLKMNTYRLNNNNDQVCARDFIKSFSVFPAAEIENQKRNVLIYLEMDKSHYHIFITILM